MILIFLDEFEPCCRDIFLHINPDKRFFHKDKYLEGMDEMDRPFYEQVDCCDLYSLFVPLLYIYIYMLIYPGIFCTFFPHCYDYIFLSVIFFL